MPRYEFPELGGLRVERRTRSVPIGVRDGRPVLIHMAAPPWGTGEQVGLSMPVPDPPPTGRPKMRDGKRVEDAQGRVVMESNRSDPGWKQDVRDRSRALTLAMILACIRAYGEQPGFTAPTPPPALAGMQLVQWHLDLLTALEARGLDALVIKTLDRAAADLLGLNGTGIPEAEALLDSQRTLAAEEARLAAERKKPIEKRDPGGA